MKLKTLLKSQVILLTIAIVLMFISVLFIDFRIRNYCNNAESVQLITELKTELDEYKQEIKDHNEYIKEIEQKIVLLTELIDTNKQIQDNLVKENDAMKKSLKRTSYPYISWYNSLAKKYNVDYGYVFEVSQIVIKYCKENKISSNHIMALIGVESEFNPNAKSYLGQSYGSGLCQVSDIVRQEYNWHSGDTEVSKDDLFNEEINIKVACWYYARLRDHYKVGKDMPSIMSAYNKGYKGGHAKNYVSKINANLSLLK